MEKPVVSDPRRSLPSVDRLARELEAQESAPASWALREGARRALRQVRESLRASKGTGLRDWDGPDALAALALAHAEQLSQPSPRRVVNATGVILHTNLGRSALAPEAARAVAEVGAAYTDLELDLASGQRGQRLDRIEALLCLLSGAEAALAVNNNAAAVLLALDSLARGREVVVSRGELVEIGGSFRVPEILERAGVRLVEVGTTNRTHPRDYEAAIGPETGALLKVHRSNFEQRGFVAEVTLPELVRLGRAGGVPVVEDLGSGTLVDLRPQGLPAESFAPARVASGADLVCFSGDKLLGGPQAGLLLGRRETLAKLRSSPLARALRLDKQSLAALDWTLRAYLDGRVHELPTLRMLQEKPASIAQRAKRLAERLTKVLPQGLALERVATRAPVGGGSLPGFELESQALALVGGDPDAQARALRGAAVPVLARVFAGQLLLDVRTLLPGDDEAIEAAVRQLPSPRSVRA